MSFDRSEKDGIHILTPRSNLVGGKETEALVAVAEEIAAAGHPQIIIDLGKISYLSSVGLGSLVKMNTSCVNREGWMRVARVGNRIKNLLLVTKLVFVFDTYETVEEALAGKAAE